tara:strand:+ start:123 stop:563 length:441 start_codon:yes stop_codon:yes gene_type:complete
VLLEGEWEFPAESEDVLGFGVSPRISDTDLWRMAPEATLVVMRSRTGGGAGVDGVLRGVAEGVTDDAFDSFAGFGADSNGFATTGEATGVSVAGALSNESLTVVLSISMASPAGVTSSSASESGTSGCLGFKSLGSATEDFEVVMT